MTSSQKISLFLVRISLGGLFLYAGVSKLMKPGWTAASYIGNAQHLVSFYHWILSPSILPFINFINEWGLTLLGVSLILGVFVRLSSVLGALLMALYYLPLPFPHPSATAYIIDEHVIYFFILVFFVAVCAGRIYGLDGATFWPIRNSLLG